MSRPRSPHFVPAIFLVAAVAACAGCAAPIASEPEDLESDPALARLDADLLTVRPPGIDLGGYEPNIGVTPDGILYTYGQLPEYRFIVVRSRDEGETWEQADGARPGEPANGDPWLHVDRATGRVFNAPLLIACIWLQWTDDEGASWETNPRGGCGAPLFHFQKVTTGPPVPGVETSGYPNVVYVSSVSLREPDASKPFDLIVGGTDGVVTRSLDGGRTFAASIDVHPMEPGCYALPAGVAVAPDGTAYSIQGRCDGLRVSRSDDSGATWTTVAMVEDVGWLAYGPAPSLVVRPDGSLVVLHSGKDGAAYVFESRDQGETWTPPARLDDGSANTTMFPSLAIDEEGNVFAAFLGTSSRVDAWPRPMSTYAPDDVVWHLYVAAQEAGADSWRVERVTSDEDPVQRGCIYMGGDDDLTGAVDACRNLGDFIGVTAQARQAWAVYVDGCEACADAASSRSGVLSVARIALDGRAD